MHLAIPVEGIAEIDHAVQKHHVRTRIHPAFPHHQVLFGEFADQGSVVIHNRQTTDVVVADQLHGVLQ